MDSIAFLGLGFGAGILFTYLMMELVVFALAGKLLIGWGFFVGALTGFCTGYAIARAVIG